MGRGGRSGLCYEVSLSSLSEAIGGPLSNLSPVAPHDWRPTARNDQSATMGARFAAIEAALQHGRGTAGRAAATRAEAAKGKHAERTLQRWIDQAEKHGIAGLARKRPSDAGRARVLVWRGFDKAFRAAGHDEATLAQLGGITTSLIQGAWKGRDGAEGWREVSITVNQYLWEACRDRGISLPDAVFMLPRSRIEPHRHFSAVAQRRYDRKAYEDAQPRVRRDWTGYAPLEIVIADVKHLDVVLQRPDGSRTWPKIVAFMDGGTGRVFAYPVLLPVGEGVRQEHVVEAFLAMVEDERWGFPKGLYLDNGSEFKVLDKMTAALQLLSEPDARTIIHARPYNAAAKPIESAFSRLDRSVFSKFAGHAGGNRMAPKVQTVGRETTPYPGSWESFCDQMQGLLHAYNATPRAGQWGGRSPNDWFRQKLEGGWRPVRVHEAALDAAFCDRASRRVGKSGLKIGGNSYFHPELPAFTGRNVAVALPWRRGAEPLFQIPGGGWRQLAADEALPALWREGAPEAARRQKGRNQAVSALEKAAPELDALAARVRYGERHPAPVPTGRPDRLDTGGELKALADERARSPQAHAAQLSEEELARRRRDATTQRLLRSQSHVA
jgi:hypothetical protein